MATTSQVAAALFSPAGPETSLSSFTQPARRLPVFLVTERLSFFPLGRRDRAQIRKIEASVAEARRFLTANEIERAQRPLVDCGLTYLMDCARRRFCILLPQPEGPLVSKTKQFHRAYYYEEEDADYGRECILAVQLLKGEAKKAWMVFHQETRALRKLHAMHIPNIPAYYGAITSLPGQCAILSELFSTDLCQWYAERMHQKSIETIPKSSTFEILHILCDIIDGLEALHERNLVHRDIKLENIVLQVTPGIKAALIDFEMMQEATQLAQSGGTKEYLSPEALIRYMQKRSFIGLDLKAVDMWSFGVCLLIVISGGWASNQLHLFANELFERQGIDAPTRFDQLMTHVTETDPFVLVTQLMRRYIQDVVNDIQMYYAHGYLVEDPNYLSREVLPLTERLLSINPKERPTAREAREVLHTALANIPARSA